MSTLNSQIVAAAIGATVGFISAAGIFLYHKLSENKEHAGKKINIDAVNRQLIQLQKDIETLRIQYQQKKKRRINRRNVSNDNTATDDIDTFSAGDTDIGDDEFFDCTKSEGNNSEGTNSEEIDIEENIIENGTIEITDEIDYRIFDNNFDKEIHEDSDYSSLRKLALKYPDNVNIIWRYAKSCKVYSDYLPSHDVYAKKSILLKGINMCEKFLENGIEHPDFYIWYAVLLGSYGENLSIPEQIKNGYRFQEYMIKACQLRPNDSLIHYLIGRYKYEIASLSWMEKKIASTLFSELPSASYETAIESFLKSEDFAKSVNLENRLYLSKCYIQINNCEEASRWLRMICDFQATKKSEIKIKDEAMKLRYKYE